MRANNMIVALPVFGMFALVIRQGHTIEHMPASTALSNAQDTKPATGGRNNIALTTKTIARMAIPNPFMKAVSPMSGEWLTKPITASGWGRL